MLERPELRRFALFQKGFRYCVATATWDAGPCQLSEETIDRLSEEAWTAFYDALPRRVVPHRQSHDRRGPAREAETRYVMQVYGVSAEEVDDAERHAALAPLLPLGAVSKSVLLWKPALPHHTS